MHNLAAFERLGWVGFAQPCPNGPSCHDCAYFRRLWWKQQCGQR